MATRVQTVSEVMVVVVMMVMVVVMVVLVCLCVVPVASATTPKNTVVVYPAKTLPESSFFKVLAAGSMCRCRVLCQTVPQCTASSLYPKTGAASDPPEVKMCGLSKKPFPPALLQLNPKATTVIVWSRVEEPPTTTTSTTPAPIVTVFVSNAHVYNGLPSQLSAICGIQRGDSVFIPTPEYVSQLETADTEDGDVDIDAETGIWINMEYDSMKRKHVLYDGSYFEDAPDFSKFAFKKAYGDCFVLKAGMTVTSNPCSLISTQTPKHVACRKITYP